MKPLEFRNKGWSFKVNLKSYNDFDIEIIDPEQTLQPNRLFKYYSLSKNSVEALIENYLFASHPRHFNDPYDCNMYIFDLTNTPLELFENFLKVIEDSNKSFSVNELYHSNRMELYEMFINGLWHIMYSKCGIVSLSNLPLSIQMWAYYSKLSGFQITLNTNSLPENFKGPIKVRYSSDIDRIPVHNDLFLPILYQISNKELNWKHESEWRYLVVGPDEMENPFNLFKNSQNVPHNRKFYYKKEALKEITLGCYFFQPDEKKGFEGNKHHFDLSEPINEERSLKIKVLDYIVQNPNIKVYILYWEKFKDYRLIKVPCKICKTSLNIFEMETLIN